MRAGIFRFWPIRASRNARLLMPQLPHNRSSTRAVALAARGEETNGIAGGTVEGHGVGMPDVGEECSKREGARTIIGSRRAVRSTRRAAWEEQQAYSL